MTNGLCKLFILSYLTPQLNRRDSNFHLLHMSTLSLLTRKVCCNFVLFGFWSQSYSNTRLTTFFLFGFLLSFFFSINYKVSSRYQSITLKLFNSRKKIRYFLQYRRFYYRAEILSNLVSFLLPIAQNVFASFNYCLLVK